MRCFKGFFLVCLVALISGCASKPQQPISLTNDFIGGKTGRIGVATNKIPQASTGFPGAGCLLCYAAASLAHTSLTTYTETLPADEIVLLKKELVEVLKGKAIDAVEIATPVIIADLPDFEKSAPNVARKDFTGLRGKLGIDRILIIDVTTHGFVRNYSAYVPTSDPKAIFSGSSYIVNLSNNTYEWYEPIEISKGAAGNWDEPPKFPGLTNAYFQSVEIAKDRILKPFGNSIASQSPQTGSLTQNQTTPGSR